MRPVTLKQWEKMPHRGKSWLVVKRLIFGPMFGGTSPLTDRMRRFAPEVSALGHTLKLFLIIRRIIFQKRRW